MAYQSLQTNYNVVDMSSEENEHVVGHVEENDNVLDMFLEKN